MPNIRSALDSFLSNLLSAISTFGIKDAIDVLIVAYLLYHTVRLVRETRAMQLMKGILAIFVVYFLAMQLRMITLSFLIQNIFTVGLFAIVVVFQPELRRVLEQVGNTSLPFTSNKRMSEREQQQTVQLIETICQAAGELASTKTGALMVIERKTRLGEIIATGSIIDATPSPELIENIFFHNSPLHDGAMVIRETRLYAAGCYLPLSQNMSIARELGTRHRAALGMSEASDAVVVVVSEETGFISVAVEGRLQRNLSAKNLSKLLWVKLLGDQTQEEETPKHRFWKVKK